ETLEYNLKHLEYAPDAEAVSQTLFALCGLLYRQARYREVARYYERALGQYAKRFEDAGTLTQARYQLANSYQQIASQANMEILLDKNQTAETRAHFQREHRQWLVKAAGEVTPPDACLESPAGQTPAAVRGLTGEQRIQVPFVTAKCWFNLGQYEKALAIYERLLGQHSGKVEGLDALGGAVSCHAAMGQVGKVRQRLLEIDRAIKGMPPEIREPWEGWLKKARQGLQDVQDNLAPDGRGTNHRVTESTEKTKTHSSVFSVSSVTLWLALLASALVHDLAADDRHVHLRPGDAVAFVLRQHVARQHHQVSEFAH